MFKNLNFLLEMQRW